MASTATPFRIAIIGSGPIGKLLACSSASHPGLELVQYEADTLPLRPSFGYGVGPQSLRGFTVANASVGRAVRAGCITSPTFMRVQHGGETGEDAILAEPQMEPGRDYGWIGRDELLDILDSKMPDAVRPVHYGKQLTSITKVTADSGRQRLQLQFQDGTEDVVDGIWGCDGLNSICRRFLQGDAFTPPAYTGRIAFRGRVPASEVISRLGSSVMQETTMFVGVEGWHILTFPIHGGKLLNIAAFSVQPEYTRLGRDVKLDKDQILAYFPGRSKTIDGILQMMIDLTPGGCQRLDMMHLGQLGAFTSDSTTVTLFGDAANAMTPHVAGSMSTGIVGVATFILEWNRQLEQCNGDIAKAFAEASEAYEVEHKPLAQDLVDRSLEQGQRWGGGITDPDVLLEHPKYLWYIADHLPVA